MASIQYKRLTRTRARTKLAIVTTLRTSLWLGDDHLLFVETNGYTETYKRFYFRDIQALIIEKTQRGTIVNRVLYVLLALVTIQALILENEVLKIFLFILAGLFGLVLLINLVRGQTCRTFLRTAVQIEHLPPLSRVSRTLKVFARIRPFIVTAQGGELSPQTISEFMRAQNPTSAAASVPNLEQLDVPPRIDT